MSYKSELPCVLSCILGRISPTIPPQQVARLAKDICFTAAAAQRTSIVECNGEFRHGQRASQQMIGRLDELEAAIRVQSLRQERKMERLNARLSEYGLILVEDSGVCRLKSMITGADMLGGVL